MITEFKDELAAKDQPKKSLSAEAREGVMV
jgi:hypothetical protein